MVIWVAVIAAVTTLLCTILICAAIAARPKTPCRFDHSIMIVGEHRIGDGSPCRGSVDNVYATADIRLLEWNGARVCDAHVGHLLDLVDNLLRQEPLAS